jgi:hypothetical protein
MTNRGPCLCGDPYCPRCFPQYMEDNEDAADEAYEIERQRATDAGLPWPPDVRPVKPKGDSDEDLVPVPPDPIPGLGDR